MDREKFQKALSVENKIYDLNHKKGRIESSLVGIKQASNPLIQTDRELAYEDNELREAVFEACRTIVQNILNEELRKIDKELIELEEEFRKV